MHPVGPAEFEVEGRKSLYYRFAEAAVGRQKQVEQINSLGIVMPFIGLAPDPPLSDLSNYAGSYFNKELAASYVIFTEQGKLMVRRPNYPPSPLVRLSGNRFATNQDMAAPMVLEFPTPSGKQSVFVLTVGDIHDLRFVRKP